MVAQGYYRHYKGETCHVLGISTNTESERMSVVYTDPSGKMWNRPYTMFVEDVEGTARYQRWESQLDGEAAYLQARKSYAKALQARRGTTDRMEKLKGGLQACLKSKL